MPVGNCLGELRVAGAPTVSGSKTTMSAWSPSRSRPRFHKPSRWAGNEVILRIACGSVSTCSSRANLPRITGKQPYVRGLGNSPNRTASLPTIDSGWHKPGQRTRVATERHVGRLQVLFHEQIAQRVDRILVAHDGDLGHRTALVLMVVRPLEVGEPDVLPATAARANIA